ncbi:MAG: DUF2207 domain-containing protein [Actinomycetales bacterium]|nr:DUF2207 domain-containing protein [Actinomycetales bacterium]
MSSRWGRLAAAAGAIAVAGVTAVALAVPASAETIQDFEVQTTVNTDTSFTVTETIRYDFESAYRHGIFRDIPVYDETSAGDRRNYQVSIDSVTMDGAPVQYATSDNGPYLNLKIGDPDVTITGPHDYVVRYTVQDGLRVITQQDATDPKAPAGLAAGDVELYWDFVGTGWEVPIQRAHAAVIGPAEAIAAKCFYGSFGGTDQCTAASAKNAVSLGPVSLRPGDALTGSIVWPASAFSRAPTENITKAPPSPLLGVAGALLPALLIVIVPIVMAVRRRREDAGAPIPGAPAQYSPPDGLPPAEMAAAWHGSRDASDSTVLLATLLDLAARRWINVRNEDSHLAIDWVGTGTTPMRPWEQSLVGVILKNGTSGTLEGYDKELATLWATDFRSLVTEQERAGRRNPVGDAPDQRWNWLGLVAGVLLLGGFASLFFAGAFIGAIVITLGVGALIGFVAARIITPRKETQQSALFLAKVAGFEKVLGTDPAAARREFAQRSGLAPEAIFATMLPYAVVFGLENAWLGAFPDLTPEQLHSYGYYVGGMWAMNDLMTTGTTSMTSAMTAPSSGSGGGGFSGGGGGSW